MLVNCLFDCDALEFGFTNGFCLFDCFVVSEMLDIFWVIV
jgi:hypothetical protein